VAWGPYEGLSLNIRELKVSTGSVRGLPESIDREAKLENKHCDDGKKYLHSTHHLVLNMKLIYTM
jgi:hypothetical protein